MSAQKKERLDYEKLQQLLALPPRDYEYENATVQIAETNLTVTVPVYIGFWFIRFKVNSEVLTCNLPLDEGGKMALEAFLIK